jgi:hypothetical protein
LICAPSFALKSMIVCLNLVSLKQRTFTLPWYFQCF